jgi:hypothetical protein
MLLNNDDIELEIQTFEYCWYQGPSAFKEGQRSLKKIFKLLILMYGSLCTTKYILKIMSNQLSHLNGMSCWKLKVLIGNDM